MVKKFRCDACAAFQHNALRRHHSNATIAPLAVNGKANISKMQKPQLVQLVGLLRGDLRKTRAKLRLALDEERVSPELNQDLCDVSWSIIQFINHNSPLTKNS